MKSKANNDCPALEMLHNQIIDNGIRREFIFYTKHEKLFCLHTFLASGKIQDIMLCNYKPHKHTRIKIKQNFDGLKLIIDEKLTTF